MRPFQTLAEGSFYRDSASNWFRANASGPCTVLVYDAPRAPVKWLFDLRFEHLCYRRADGI